MLDLFTFVVAGISTALFIAALVFMVITLIRNVDES